jgi:hypothetical protein
MGLVLMAALAAGGVLGLIVTSVVGGGGVALTLRSAKTRSHAWRIFGAVCVIVLPLCIYAVHHLPYDPVSPGSDYDVAMKNLFLQALGYCASPGMAALAAGMATWLAPRRSNEKVAT